MSVTETTELKLKTTPTGGLDASHSPYYRRLLSAGYKGYLQGTIGGASLYGAIGLAIGGLVALPLLATPVGWAALALIPAVGGIGLVKGASTFGEIGSMAAINAESADLAEQRRYLLDRYHDLPEGPEGDREAAEIRKELIRRQDNNASPPPLFHWKTVAVCAAIGAALALTMLCTPIGAAVFGETALTHVFGALGIHAAAAGGTATAAGATGLSAMASGGALTAIGTAVGTGLGALAGAVVGLDRYYVRKWFDVTEGIVHSSPRTDIEDPALRERSDLVTRLNAASKEDAIVKETLAHRAARATASVSQPAAPAASPAPAAPVANAAPSAPQLSRDSAAKPTNKVSEATAHDRMAMLQRAMEVSL